MTLLQEIYRDVVATLAMAGGNDNRSLCANELRAIRNRLEPLMPPHIVEETKRYADIFAEQQ